MTLEEKYKMQYEIGFPIFNKLFQLKKEPFVKVMKDIFKDNNSVLDILKNNPTIIKTLEDDEPEKISLNFYDSISINCFGVKFKPEHGTEERILKFDEFLNIDNVLIGL